MLYILVFVLGFLTCFVLFLVAYVVVRQLIFRYGKEIVTTAEKEIGRLIDKSMDNAAIIYPQTVVEAFNAGADIDKILKD